MIISNSSIGMDSARTYTSVRKDAVSFEASSTSFLKTLEGKDLNDKSVKDENSEKDESSLENTKRNFDDIFNKMKTYATSNDYASKLDDDYRNKIITKCIQYLLSMLLGIKPQDSEALELEPSKSKELPNNSSSGKIITLTNTLTTKSFYTETETTDFSTMGSVITKDGRQIDFNLDLSMSRSFTSYTEIKETSSIQFVDPLVINIDSDIADVSDVKILFDLDSDGEEEDVSLLSKGSGYLALDLNNDGKINNGSELFGTSSGDGFKDLSKYDSDGNGWIDEADDIFSKLKICVFDEDGSQTLYSLKDKDIGAISLKSADTEFSLNSLETNAVNARIRKTGIFLYENGNVGTLQHLDLAQ